MSWAPYVSRSLSPSTRVWTLRRSVNGGMTVTSTLSKYLSGKENAIFCTRAMASKWLRFIFQLPAISGLRAMDLRLQYLDAGQFLALKVFQRRPAAGGNVRETVVGQAQLTHRGRGVPAADAAERALAGGADDRLGHPLGARGERRELEDPHRAIPKHRLGVG